MKRIAIMLCIALICMAVFPALGEQTIRGYSETDGYCYVELGTYPMTEDGERGPVLWRVLDVSDGQALLLSDKILDVQQVIFCDNMRDSDARKFRKISDYGESDLNTWMNETMLADLCSELDFSSALVEGQYGRLYPPTEEQLLKPEYGFSKTRWIDDSKRLECRQFTATDYAKVHELYKGYTKPANNKLYVDRKWGTSSAWVANVKNPKDVKLGLIGYNGHLSYGVYTRVNVGVLPALTLDLEKCTVSGGTGTAEDPFTISIP